MGKLILCSGMRTKRPYVLAASGIRVYSIEELCYYISTHIYIVDEELFKDSLIDWLDTELGLTTRAEKLKTLKEHKADIKTLLAALLCSADYFTEQEIKNLIKKVDELSRMTPVRRSCVRADGYLYDHKYHKAADEYEKILSSKDAEGMTPEEYGDILHNLAVAKVHSKGIKTAAEYFRQAYERNRREESLRQYLYALKLSEKTDSFNEKLEDYQVRDDFREDILTKLDQIEMEAEVCEGMVKLHKLKRLRSEGRMNDYNHHIDEMIETWITELRKI